MGGMCKDVIQKMKGRKQSMFNVYGPHNCESTWHHPYAQTHCTTLEPYNHLSQTYHISSFMAHDGTYNVTVHNLLPFFPFYPEKPRQAHPGTLKPVLLSGLRNENKWKKLIFHLLCPELHKFVFCMLMTQCLHLRPPLFTDHPVLPLPASCLFSWTVCP